jgi:hypothetical protein
MEVRGHDPRGGMPPGFSGCVHRATQEASMPTGSAKLFAVIIERNGQELVRDVLHIDGAADARLKLMQIVRRHEINSFDEPIHCRVEELPE